MQKGFELATAVALTAVVGTAHAADKIKIGVTATLEGTYTVLGEDGMRGYELAVKAHGGKAGGREIETIVGSTDASPDFRHSRRQEAGRAGQGRRPHFAAVRR